MKKNLFFLSGLMATQVSWAHPGHGAGNPFSITHYLFEPVHAFVTIACIVVAIVVWKNKKAAGAKK